MMGMLGGIRRENEKKKKEEEEEDEDKDEVEDRAVEQKQLV